MFARSLDVHDALTLDGRAFVSRNNEFRWTGTFIARGRSLGSADGVAGHHAILMPTDATMIPVSGGVARAIVTNSRLAQDALTGGIPLNAWEGLWARMASPTGSALMYRIQAYGAASVADADMDSQWVLLVARDGDGVFHVGDGGKLSRGGQYGGAQPIQAGVYRFVRHTLGLSGYAFSPWSAIAGVFGFTGTFRANNVGAQDATQFPSNGNGIDIMVPAAGTAILGWAGAPNTVWRVTTTVDNMTRFGGAATGASPISAAPGGAVVCDLGASDSLYFAPNQMGASAGSWYRTRTENAGSIPEHWVFICKHNSTDPTAGNPGILLWNGTILPRGEAAFAGTFDQAFRQNKAVITSAGQWACRFTQAGFFAGTAANGVGTAGATTGVLIAWPDNTVMWGMNTASSDGVRLGNTYHWMNLPAAGVAIPMMDSAGTRTRVVQSIPGSTLKWVPLAPWECLLYVPPQGWAAGTTAAAGGWFVTNYGDPRTLPANAITVASFAAPGSISGAGVTKTRVLMGDGVYISPGTAAAGATLAYGDQAQGTTQDWMIPTVRGATVPGGTAFGAAVAGLTVGDARYRYLAGASEPRGVVEFNGALMTTAAIVDGTAVLFIAGVTPLGSPIMSALARHGANNAVPTTVMLQFASGVQSGQTGTLLRVYGYGTSNNTAAAGGAYGASGIISLAGIRFAHA